jgi:N-acetylglucosamine malate deacetylase 1
MTAADLLDQQPVRVLLLGAHPDDAEFHAGGLLAAHAARGSVVKLVSVTDGGAGHHRLTRDELVQTRRREAAEAGHVLGVPYETWDFPDGQLEPDLALRGRIIREIRAFRPDLVLTHRTCDYHPDHRAVGQAVQDASYLVTVPLVEAAVPHLRRDPVVACMCDLFTRPTSLRPDVVRDIRGALPAIVRMLACHHSQVFDFLPYNQGLAGELPADPEGRLEWLRNWFCRIIRPRADRFREAVCNEYGDAGRAMEWIEAYEISEYAAPLAAGDRGRLFPR